MAGLRYVTKMKNHIKKIFIYFGIFLMSVLLMLGLLVLSACVRTESMQGNFEDSAELLCENNVFTYMEEDVAGSCIDRYADSILLNIAYNFEPDNAMESVMWSSFYSLSDKNENITFSETVKEGKEKNTQYLRYWHGSAGVVRLLHIFLSLGQIYVLFGVVLAVLFIILVFLLIRSRCVWEAAALGISMIAVSIWYVPFSLEYTWVFLCMFAFSIAAARLVKSGRERHLGIMFMVSGMVTIYFDFLTTETLTFTVPMILVLVLKKHGYGSGSVDIVSGKALTAGQDKQKNSNTLSKNLIYILKNVCLWGIGYAGMWVSKWLIASVVLGENVMPYVTGHIEERLAGSLGNDVSFIEYLWMAVSRNIKSLFPVDHGTWGVIAFCILILAVAYFCFVYRKKKIEWSYVILMLIIGFIPVVRLLVLRNHSAIHYFFAYRALAGTVFAILVSAGAVTDFGIMRKTHSKHKK
ncbi:MAG: hypothetical protein K6G24_13970 [Lachnospiraceae bacterium]|nr:hypothetical protein [Lachnospiraceae bacterium]